MVLQSERASTAHLYSGSNTYDCPDSPMFFGAEGGKTQATAITDEPLLVGKTLYSKLTDITQQVSDFIESYPLSGRALDLGLDPRYLQDGLDFDISGRDHLVYGGLDIYVDPDLEPKVLELNARVQAKGLQETRLAHLGINDQPRMIDHFIARLRSEGFDRVMVLGSKLNPFWRSHARLSRELSLAGFECSYNDAQQFEDLNKQGFNPDVVVKLLNSEFILYSPLAGYLREQTYRQIPFVNSVASTFYGDRGFLTEMAKALPGVLPDQVKLDSRNLEEVTRHPWLKLEAGKEIAFVVNFNELRRWGKDALGYMIQGQYDKAAAVLNGKGNGSALALNEVREKIKDLPDSQINWVAQQDVRPLKTKLLYQGEETDMTVLHRVYFVRRLDGKVEVSMEGFGCTDAQLAQSKGKINGGSGIAIPMVIA